MSTATHQVTRSKEGIIVMELEQKVIEAIYDGRALWRGEPINLEPGSRVSRLSKITDKAN
jgi:hypothetical protein